jgi:hypothetical protein
MFLIVLLIHERLDITFYSGFSQLKMLSAALETITNHHHSAFRIREIFSALVEFKVNI